MLAPRARSNLSHHANGDGADRVCRPPRVFNTRGLARRRGSALNRVRESYSLVKQPSSFPRRVFCARGLFFASRTRNEGWAERRKSVGCLRGTRSACSDTPGACEAPCVPRRGTPASRRSTVAILGPGAALPSPDLRPDRSQRAPRIRVLVPGGRGPGASRGERLPAARRGTPLLAPSSRRCSRRHPSGARMDVDVASARSQAQIV